MHHKSHSKFTSLNSLWAGPKSNENSVPPDSRIHHLIKAQLQLWLFRLFTLRRKAPSEDGCELPTKMQDSPKSENDSSERYDLLLSREQDLDFNAKNAIVIKAVPKWWLCCEYLHNILPATFLLELCVTSYTLLKVLKLRNRASSLGHMKPSKQTRHSYVAEPASIQSASCPANLQVGPALAQLHHLQVPHHPATSTMQYLASAQNYILASAFTCQQAWCTLIIKNGRGFINL